MELDRVEVRFDPMTWIQDISEQHKSYGTQTSDESMVFLRNLGIYGQTDYKSMIMVHKTTEGY